MGRRGMGQYALLLSKFKQLNKELSISLAHEKTEGPNSILMSLGIIETEQQLF